MSSHVDVNSLINVLNLSIKQRLIEKYSGEINDVIDVLVAKKKIAIRQQIEADLKDVTVESLHRSKDMLDFADRLIVAFKFNAGDGRTILPNETVVMQK